MPDPTTMTICMGSSCFSRGNNRHVQTIKGFLAEHGMTADVTLAGSRCEGLCMHGPNVRIDGELVPELNDESLQAALRARCLRG